MTNLQAVNAAAGFASPDASIAEKALIDVGLQAGEGYKIENSSLVDKAAIAVLIALKRISSIGQGSYSISFNKDEADRTIRFLYQKIGGPESGLPDPLLLDKPVINNASNLW